MMNRFIAIEEVKSLVRQLREENADLRKQIRTDRLTGIFNMQALEEHVSASRYDGYYIFADMDGLGVLNKTAGHHVVDGYIKEFGLWLRASTRLACDAIAIRQHGDEFLVWCSNKRAAIAIRNRIRQWCSKDGIVTCSAGMGRKIETADSNCSHFKHHVRK